jgi:hypothetical protein
LDKFLDENLKTGRIRPSKSPYASPFFFVKKSDSEELQLIQDYQKLNDNTIPDWYLLLLISELMHQMMKNTMIFTKLDIWRGFPNVCIKEEDKWMAAFVTN